jgi:hypothetical protein
VGTRNLPLNLDARNTRNSVSPSSRRQRPNFPQRKFLDIAYTTMITFCMLARQITLPPSAPVLSPLCFHNFTNRSSHLPTATALYFHGLTNPFPGNAFVFTSIQNPRVSPSVLRAPACPRWQVANHPADTTPLHSYCCGLFGAFARSFSRSAPLFSSACSLFYQNTRVGVCSCPLLTTHHPLSGRLQFLSGRPTMAVASLFHGAAR